MSLKTKFIASDQKTPRKTFIKEALESMLSKFLLRSLQIFFIRKIEQNFEEI